MRDCVEVDIGQNRVIAVKWQRNRLHYNPRIFSLYFEGQCTLLSNEEGQLRTLLSKALATLAEYDPLLLRVTLDSGSPFLSPLRQLGFLDTRNVYVVGFRIPELLQVEDASAYLPSIRLVSLAEALVTTSEEALTELWLEIYGHAARIDPATPHQLSATELHDLFLGDGNLDHSVSVCAFDGERLVGICPAYETGAAQDMELGTVGVETKSMGRHQEISLAMLRSASRRAANKGIERFSLEVDSDSHWSLYPSADLPGQVEEVLVSLMYVPKWASSRW